jgi:hypothetical protein
MIAGASAVPDVSLAFGIRGRQQLSARFGK